MKQQMLYVDEKEKKRLSKIRIGILLLVSISFLSVGFDRSVYSIINMNLETATLDADVDWLFSVTPYRHLELNLVSYHFRYDNKLFGSTGFFGLVPVSMTVDSTVYQSAKATKAVKISVPILFPQFSIPEEEKDLNIFYCLFGLSGVICAGVLVWKGYVWVKMLMTDRMK